MSTPWGSARPTTRSVAVLERFAFTRRLSAFPHKNARGGETALTEAERPGASRNRVAVLAVCAFLLTGAAGVGGYFVGKSTGEDLDAARDAGVAAGQRKGAAVGSKQGYEIGFKKGRERGYEQTFDDAYRGAYRKAFEDAGLDPPGNIEVPD